MQPLKLALMLLLSLPQIASASDTLSINDVAGYDLRPKRVSGVNPIAGTSEYASIEDDGQRITAYSFKTGKKTATLIDLAQTKQSALESIDDYAFSPDGKKMLLQTNTKPIYRRSYTADHFIFNRADLSIMPLSEKGGEQIPTFSPDGNTIAYVRDNNIYVRQNGTERQLTTDGSRNHVINGLPDWVSEEELSFNNALAWSPDGQYLSYIRYDESAVKTYDLQMFQGLEPKHDENADYPSLYSYKYPKAGEQNARMSVHAIRLSDGNIATYQLPLDADGYVARIKTTPQGIAIITLNRHQDLLSIYSANPEDGSCRLLYQEQGDRYIQAEVLDGIYFGKTHMLIPSDRDGNMALYLASMSDKETPVRLTRQGEEVVTVYGYDDQTNTAYYLAVGRTPMDRVVCKASPKGVTTLSKDDAFITATFSGDYKYFLATESSLNTPPRYTIYDSRGKAVREVLNNDEFAQSLLKYELSERELFQFTTSENMTLNGWMVRPANFDNSRKYPVILFQYGGPGNQQVLNSWNAGSMGNGGLFDHYLAQHGFVVVCVDGRGTGGRGPAFEKQTYLQLGLLEAKDQVEAALWVGKQSWADPDRIGIWGWSFGGFNTLMSMSEGRPVFRAGVAVAPPTSWKYYDTIYTERYMRTPQENPDGYAINPINRAQQLHGALLICHGLADDNVHPQNTFEYTEALVQADKDFHMNIYTNRNHSIYGGNTRNHLLRQIAQWFEEKLKK